MLPIFLVDAFSACFIVRWCLFSGGWGPLPIPGAGFPGERILIDPLVGALLGDARHDGPQQRELVRCILAVPGQQCGHYACIQRCHEERVMRIKVIWPMKNTVPVREF